LNLIQVFFSGNHSINRSISKDKTMMDPIYNQIDSYFSGEMTNSEKILFSAEIQSNPALKEDFIEMQNTIGLLCFTKSSGDDQLAFEKLAEFKRRLKNRNVRKMTFSLMKYAAVTALIIMSTIYLSRNEGLIPKEKAFTEIEATSGQRVHMKLSDGSSVWLNARSKIKFANSFNQKERVVLLDGEAFFDVKKDHGKPFVVKTKRYNIKVLGTQFNVFDYADKALFETTLMSGSVQVYEENKEKSSIILAPNEQVVLKNNKLEKSRVNSTEYSTWKNGIMTFDSQPLQKIINKLELYYGVNFVISDNISMNALYTGKFRMEDSVQNILSAIQKTNKFKFTTGSDNKTIYIK